VGPIYTPHIGGIDVDASGMQGWVQLKLNVCYNLNMCILKLTCIESNPRI